MKAFSLVVIFALLTACATSSSSFYSKRGTFSNATLCRTHANAIEAGDRQLAADVENDLRQQFGTEVSECERIIKEQNNRVTGAIVAVAAVAAIAAAAANSGGGGGSSTSSDYQWDWDIFYNQYGQLVAACRGVQTGQFADGYRCAGQVQDDNRWPGY